MDLNLNLVCYGQTNPEGRARLTRRLIMDLVFIVICESEYSTVSKAAEGLFYNFDLENRVG